MRTNSSEFLAHTTSDGRTHPLADHLEAVGTLASRFADPFGGGVWAQSAGTWHDLGKYRPGFQAYIRQVGGPDAHIEGRVGGREKTHSAAGALHAIEAASARHGRRGGIAARVLAYLVAGHHAGLGDWIGGLDGRLFNSEDNRREYQEALAAAPVAIPNAAVPSPDLPSYVPGGVTAPGAFALWVRMLFSCLVDADFLDTESFMDEGKASNRQGFPSLTSMREAYDAHMGRFAADTPVRRIRAGILRECREAAALAPGIFTLTVPTGGGKTLASLGFALDHAIAQGKRRIIYAIPYTSIIEQTAEVFRAVFKALGPNVLVEHHSQAESDATQETAASRLACENWDAPLIVTTNVQLFESLFAARTSRCRKLHSLVGSVLILDEAQQLPPEFLQPILDVLNLLVKHYGVSVVLCTATQPALASRQYFDAARSRRGLDAAREIIADPDALYAKLKRVTVTLPADLKTPCEWPALAQQIASHDCVLAIVNTRKAARELHALLPADTLHLSALMCGAHRTAVIEQIKARLAARRAGLDDVPLRVISTQLVEAGVDLDFPVVFRALAGLDSIAQAAGRCNREGLLDGTGKVVVFVPPTGVPPGHMRKGVDACVSVLHAYAGDPLERTLFESYFEQLYASTNLDREGIVDLLTRDITDRDQPLAVAFRTAAEKFRLIDHDDQALVVVRYRSQLDDNVVDTLLGKLAKDGPERWLMRALQRYIVTIPKREADRLLSVGELAMPMPGLFVQVSDVLYDPELGLLLRSDDISPGRLTL